ncbi:TPA: MFS transporter [Burkholderia cenocepacia]|uniref:MFS transporter n=1 Tax=Burkholderia cenocepacia TaxID=95486 RepID=UPI001B9B449B|nr:MFS transporter [Burkholderia cenocepacia]MBR8070873.1 MFS transporter [Burkholderia cenocepacia]MBR8199622.1 MFS transporter [Burkholderia cenocepacia]MBR8448295.1 MFS transporter [Burkholderia cenocepacia]HDV6324842.1 MFS transporter [Burkholderia cenocepacia]HDV6352191.1 MFS transporter [Burkholderia cenocepacia]
MTPSSSSFVSSPRQTGSAVGAMALCVAMLIASEFMPVSLLTPIAHDLNATEGIAGQAISISGFFAVLASLFVAPLAGRFDRRHVLMSMTVLMLISIVLIAVSPNFAVLMIARAFLGLAVGGFWSLSTATVIQLVPAQRVPKALGTIYMGNAIATAFAAPIGAYVGGHLGWRFVFAALVPLVLVNLVWQAVSLPSMPPRAAIPITRLFGLLKRRNVSVGMVAVMLTFAGSYGTFTYFRPFLEAVTGADANQLSMLLLGLGVAGFAGTHFAGTMLHRNHVYPLLRWLPIALAAATLGLVQFGHLFAGAATMMIGWGAVNAAIPVTWSTWLAKEIDDEPESGGGLMVGSIQLAIMLGGALGGELLDRIGVFAPLMGGVVLLVLSALLIGNGARLKKTEKLD